MMQLEWGDYQHFPYERELAVREAIALLGNDVAVCPSGEVSSRMADFEVARKLTYFAAAKSGDQTARTLQSELESSSSPKRRRQSTRYSVHGLHEYRGKFNPQVCSALINILGVTESQLLLDPFCGSGTTLVEAAHRGIDAVGTDLNPLAVFISNAKLAALSHEPAELRRSLQRVIDRSEGEAVHLPDEARSDYLLSWFETKQLVQIERIRFAIEQEEGPTQPFFLVIASNLLRDFSLQNPADLRIRRRSSANATEPFSAAFARAANDAIKKLEAALAVLPSPKASGRAVLCDNRYLDKEMAGIRFDAAITSPPYATALPYIDTQRLSLVWLGLLHPSEIGKVEADLIGSREMRTTNRREVLKAMEANSAELPEGEASFCLKMRQALGPGDGFRRQAMPALLYRYFYLMKQTFASVARVMKPTARFALIVGHNHTELSGHRFDIDTPAHLASIASHSGWEIDEITQLQPYQRYGLHAANAVKAETLVILKANSIPSR